MFTGIIEEMGQVKNLQQLDQEDGVRLSVTANQVLSDVKVGDSIAVNGICLTVTSFDPEAFAVDVMNETLDKTSLGNLQEGSPVNLERAMAVGDRFGGHIVSGHIDGTGIIQSIEDDGIAKWFTIETSQAILSYIIMKGSITIDGTSLTIAGLDEDQQTFQVSIIPHTANETLFGHYEVGDRVNIENDMIAKFVEKLMGKDQD